MTTQAGSADAVIIGGGFYGAAIAVYLVKERGLRNVVLLEREPELMMRASYNNQARVHNGYHYPRSFTTAFRSRVNLPKFVNDWPQAVSRDFVKLYAIARRNSKVTARQFERFCHEIGAKIMAAEPQLNAYFEPRLIENVYLVEEYAFNAAKLAAWAKRELAEAGIEVRHNTTATAIFRGEQGQPFRIAARTDGGEESIHAARHVFNCTYSGLNQISGDFPGTRSGLNRKLLKSR